MRLKRFSLPLAHPLGTAHGEIGDREGFIVAVDPDDAPNDAPDDAPDYASDDPVPSRGVGEATPLPGWTESLEACERTLRRVVDDPKRAAIPFEGDGSGMGESSVFEDVPAARHALSLARDDARARVEEIPLAERLLADAPAEGRSGVDGVGAEVKPPRSIPVNATVGDGSVEEAVEAAERALKDGYGCLKVKVGARDLTDDVERLNAVRRAIGPAVTLRADANGAWDRRTAAKALDRLRAVDLEYVEQPVPAADLAGLARLREEARVPIAADEALVTHGIDAVLDAYAADVVVAKPMALGGSDRAVDVAVRAAAAGVDTVVTTTVDAVVARTAAVHVVAAVHALASATETAVEPRACGLATGGMLERDLAPDPCPVERGRIEVPTDPGLAGDAFDDLV